MRNMLSLSVLLIRTSSGHKPRVAILARNTRTRVRNPSSRFQMLPDTDNTLIMLNISSSLHTSNLEMLKAYPNRHMVSRHINSDNNSLRDIVNTRSSKRVRLGMHNTTHLRFPGREAGIPIKRESLSTT
mmetsp:Transcript_30236/g.58108  ORF Transcript_30236/g.58108 Transcript_30236/m.58108 type:complete len:129 (-) Transcript_30236:478-864(-)